LYHNGTNWEDLNIADICTMYSRAADPENSTEEYPKEYEFFRKPEHANLKTE
jgi:hypothetical protein